MAHQQDLFDMTFDQQLHVTKGRIAGRDISPNRRIPGEIVFEPMGTGVRVTARDGDHKVLWGYVGAMETVSQNHCLVAMYDTLQKLVGEELEKRGMFSPEVEDPVSAAHKAIDCLEKTVAQLRESLNVKKVSDATLSRAQTIRRMISDADRQLSLEASTLKGMKSKSESIESATE